MRSTLAVACAAVALAGCGSSDDGGAGNADDTGIGGEAASDARAETDGASDADAPKPDAPPSDAESGTDAGLTRRLIKHGQDIPTAQFVHDHVATMETQPFDGVVVGSTFSPFDAA